MAELPILIVEDEPDGQELVSRILGVMNFPIDIAADGETAWETLQTTTFKAIVIDLALPGMDGIELLRKIRGDENLAATPCIAITAYHTPELKQQCLIEGFNAYFAKPIDRALFVESLANIVG